jgi:hypothetical protein
MECRGNGQRWQHPKVALYANHRPLMIANIKSLLNRQQAHGASGLMPFVTTTVPAQSGHGSMNGAATSLTVRYAAFRNLSGRDEI